MNAASESSAPAAASPPILEARNGRLWARLGTAAPQPVTLRRAQPLAAPEGPLSLLDEKKREIAWLPSLAALDPASAALAAAELARRYFQPVIRRVVAVHTARGDRLLDVETDRGPCAFAMLDPHRNVTWLDDDRLLLTDVNGNRYEIPSWRKLDTASRGLLDQVM